jgi:Arylsulfotransferase (ASST)
MGAMMFLLSACADDLTLGSKTTPTDSPNAPSIEAAAFVSGASARLHEDIPSVVYVRWTQGAASDTVWVEYRFEGIDWLQTPARPGDPGEHEQIVLGVPYDTPLEWRVVVGEGSATDDLPGPAITTGAAPELPAITVDVASADAWDPTGRFLLTSVSTEEPQTTNTPGFWLVLVDRQGRYVWAIPANERSWTLYAKPSRDGTTILYDDDLYWTSFRADADSEVHQIRLDGSEVRSWDTRGMMHSFDDLSADTIAWNRAEGFDDQIVVSAGDAEPELLWSCLDWAEASELGEAQPDQRVCGSNALAYDEASNSYVVSLWTHETVVQLDATTGDVWWHADPVGGSGYAVPREAEWAWQHEAQLLPNGHLLLSSGVDKGREGFAATASYEYAIDHAAEALTLVWSYESEKEFAAQYKGGLARLDSGNTLHWYGSAGGIKELSPAPEVVWQLRFAEGTWVGRSTWLDDLYAFVP